MQVSPIPIQAVVAGSTPLCRGSCRRDRTDGRTVDSNTATLTAIAQQRISQSWNARISSRL